MKIKKFIIKIYLLNDNWIAHIIAPYPESLTFVYTYKKGWWEELSDKN